MKRNLILAAILALGALIVYAQQPVSQSGAPWSVSQSGSWAVTANAGTNLNTSALQLDATGQASLVAGGGTTAPSKVQTVGGKTNDGTPQYDIIPEGAGGRSLIIEGFAGGTKVPVDGSGVTQPVSGTVTANAGSGTFAVSGDTNGCDGSTGSAVPAKGCYHAGNSSGNLTGYLNCENTAVYDNTTNGATQLVGLVSGKKVYVCGYQLSTSQTTAVHVALEYGTGSNCVTSPTKITPNYPLQAVASSGPIGLVIMTPGFTGLQTIASNELCILTDQAVSVQAIVWWTQF